MSRFPHQQNAIQQLWQEIQKIKAQLSGISTAGGQLRITSTSIAGGIWLHNHSDAASGGLTEYAPTVPSNWLGNMDPGDTWQALDQLAARIETIENQLIGINPIVYPTNTMLFVGMEG